MSNTSALDRISANLHHLAKFAPALPFGANQMERIANTFEKEAPRLVDQAERFVDICEAIAARYGITVEPKDKREDL